jgi:hypothetical protein
MQLMQHLGTRFEKQHTRANKVQKAMGKPQHIDLPQAYAGVYTPKAGETVWVYTWRDMHDFMYLVIENKRVKRVDWFYAYE